MSNTKKEKKKEEEKKKIDSRGVKAPANSQGGTMSIYDPRTDLFVNKTDNPILILADLMVKNGFVDITEKGKFWSQIGYLANYVEEKEMFKGNNKQSLLKKKLDAIKKKNTF